MSGVEWGTRTILGAKIMVTDVRQVVAFVDECVSTAAPARIAFVNANLATMCAKKPDVSRLLDGFTLLNDGIGMNLASRLLYGRPFSHNLNGTDLVPKYLSSSRHSLRLFLLGARPAVVQKAAGEMRRRWPSHQVVGSQHGYFLDTEAPSVRDRVARSHPDIVLVAMGNPRQEFWVAANVPDVAPVAICVGALFDFLAGDVRRAPRFVRALRLEWAFRLAQEPGRLWRRYTVEGFSFTGRLLKEYLSRKRA